MDDQKKRKLLRHRNKKHAVILLGIAAFAVWLGILVIKILVAQAQGGSVDFIGILDGIWDNLLGILPPLILIDLVFEFITQDYVSEEISEQITGTLMSNPETIRLFDDETKRKFLDATIDSIVGDNESEAEMAKSSIKSYIDRCHNLKKYFSYNISFRDDPIRDLFDPKDYFCVNETLCFEKHYIKTEPLHQLFSIGFFVSHSELDKNLRGQDFLFREDLIIRPEELDALKNMTAEEKTAFVTTDMRLKVYIGHKRCEIADVTIGDAGIAVQLRAAQEIPESVAYYEIAFCMPRLRTDKNYLVAVTEPTYSVNIRFDYPRSTCNVVMYPFFNDAEDARVEDADRGIGSYDINLRDKWVYPMSGVVFNIEPKKQ
ncbi:MAG: hypothetical protein IJA75_06820 [Oscillospiraceae bacterium]|nr:hypothetical protein [Oscillospiraceae bacterium]